jgi:hypothetical protein
MNWRTSDTIKKAAEYRRHAEECRALARNMATEQERTQFLEISATWESLALDRENFNAQHPQLARAIDKVSKSETGPEGSGDLATGGN